MMREKTPGPSAETASVILEKARAAAVSMRRVADSIGMTAMTIHWYCPNRDTLAQRSADNTFAKITASCVRCRRARTAGVSNTLHLRRGNWFVWICIRNTLTCFGLRLRRIHPVFN